ncbi:MAG: AraC family transcriptional regulator [Lachnospiraceae bacterium]|nr:AraC family transcriptional regulator [Lachnospiraceae bacterium]
MQESGYNRSRRAAAGIMIVLMLVVLLLSACCFVAEADHDCAGEDCAVCSILELCDNTIRRLGTGAVAAAVVLFAVLFSVLSASVIAVVLPQETPVSLRVRLNN